jgi:hypothetical protein
MLVKEGVQLNLARILLNVAVLRILFLINKLIGVNQLYLPTV